MYNILFTFFHDRESTNYTMEAVKLRITSYVENGSELSTKGVWMEGNREMGDA